MKTRKKKILRSRPIADVTVGEREQVFSRLRAYNDAVTGEVLTRLETDVQQGYLTGFPREIHHDHALLGPNVKCNNKCRFIDLVDEG